MMGNIFSQVPETVVGEIKAHAFALFMDLDFKRFTDKIIKKIESMQGYKTEEDYDAIAKESAEKSKYDDPKLKRLHGELVKRNLQEFDLKLEECITSLPRELSEELKKDREIMSRLKDLRIPDRDGLLEERYLRYLLGQLAVSLTITALKMTESGRRLIKKEQEGESYPGKAFYAEDNFLAMHYLGEKSDAFKKYAAKYFLLRITKDDVRRLGNSLNAYRPHKMGWLEEIK